MAAICPWVRTFLELSGCLIPPVPAKRMQGHLNDDWMPALIWT
jgi:hypothetical protein